MPISYLDKIDHYLTLKLNWKQESSPFHELTKLQIEMNPKLTWDQAQEELIWQLDQIWEDEKINFWWSKYRMETTHSQAA